MKKHLKKLPVYIWIYAVTAMLSVVMLCVSALIPRSAMWNNMVSSADILCEKRVFFQLWEKIPASKIDRYADSILLNIAYHGDPDDTLRSVMLSDYYYTEYQNENDNLLISVRDGLPANQQYLRYWHGMTIPVRIMHLFTDIRGMYIINGEIIVLLTGFLMFLLIKNKLYGGAVGLPCVFIAVGIWFVPYSLEYTAVFIIALIATTVSVILTIRGKETVLPAIFMVCGMMTCFFDFLTCETLTLLMPLLFSIYVRRRRTKTIAKENGVYALKNCILWGIGYVGMWLTKWLLAAFVLGEDVTPYIAGKLTERISDTKGESVFLYMFGGIWRNMTCLFPACLGVIGIMITIVIIIGIVLICIFYHKKGADKGSVILYAALGLIPYIRYIAIFNHSYLHFFFTYRAQAATLLAVCFIVTEIVTFGRSANALKKRKRA